MAKSADKTGTLTLLRENNIGNFAGSSGSKNYDTTSVRFDPGLRTFIATNGHVLISTAVDAAGEIPEFFIDPATLDRICPKVDGEKTLLTFKDGKLIDSAGKPVRIKIGDVEFPSMPRESQVNPHNIYAPMSIKVIKSLAECFSGSDDEQLLFSFEVNGGSRLAVNAIGFHVFREDIPVAGGLAMPLDVSPDVVGKLITESTKRSFIRDGKAAPAKSTPAKKETTVAAPTKAAPEKPAAAPKAAPPKPAKEVATKDPAVLGARLMTAAGKADHVACLALLDDGADITVTDKGGYNALTRAAKHDCPMLIRLLLERGFKAEHKPSSNITAIQTAAFHGHLANCKVLIEYKAKPKFEDVYGWNAIEKARSKGHATVVKYLESVSK